MKSLEYINKNITSPIKSLREQAQLHFVKQCINGKKPYVQKLSANLKNKDFNVVESSLEVIDFVSISNPSFFLQIKSDIKKVAKKDHYRIRRIAIDILNRIGELDGKTEKLLHPKNIVQRRQTSANTYRFDNCPYGTFLDMGGRDNESLLKKLSEAFRFNCSTSLREMKVIRKSLGYDKEIHKKEKVPKRYQVSETYYDGDDTFRTSEYSFTYHSIQKLIIQSLENRRVSLEDWKDFEQEMLKSKLPFLDIYRLEKPEGIYFPSLMPKEFLKIDNIKDIYANIIRGDWVVLYENTSFDYEDYSFHKTMISTFVNKNLTGKVSDVCPVSWETWTKYDLLEAPYGELYIDEHSNTDEVSKKIVPSFGQLKEDYGNFEKIFPTKHIIDFLDIKPINHGTVYVDKNGEEVIRVVSWINGYKEMNRGEGYRREFKTAENGTLLLMQKKYLLEYLKANKLRFLTQISIYKTLKTGYKYSDFKTSHKTFKTKELGID